MERHGDSRSTTAGEDHAGSGLEESMWKLESGEEFYYPERPDEPDCIHYLRTGHCGYGLRCRFNHPRDHGKAIGSARLSGGEYPERAGQPVCQYYMRTGTCKFGASCKYHHPRQRGGSGSSISLNYYGYPLRPGEKECAYYIRTGQCKFGATCKFSHPEPFDIQVQPPPTQLQVPQMPTAIHPSGLYPGLQSPSDPSSQQYGVVMRPTLFPGPYIGPYGPMLLPTGMVSVPGNWGPYQAPVSPVAPPGAQPGFCLSSASGMTQLSPSALAYTGAYQTVQSTLVSSSSSPKELSFPQKPDQPECQHYMKTGECKFGFSCRYHHPLEVAAEKNGEVVLSPFGLPLRLGAPTCTYYTKHGYCKFGPACKFNHPMGSLRYSPSASSLADMPVAPLRLGSVTGSLAPSSSSSNLRPELISASGTESISTNMLSSIMKSGESVGVIYSSSGSVPHSTTQQSVKVSGPSKSSSTSSSMMSTNSIMAQSSS